MTDLTLRAKTKTYPRTSGFSGEDSTDLAYVPPWIDFLYAFRLFTCFFFCSLVIFCSYHPDPVDPAGVYPVQ
jgi:hypothetical protein